MIESIFDVFKEQKYTHLASGKRLAYTETGEMGELLLFIHGMGSNKKAWAKNIHRLRQKHRCVCIDLPGYGSSQNIEGKYTITALAKVIIEFITINNFQKATLIGHSMGGHISMEIARLRPELIKQLVLVAPAGLETFPPQEIELVEKFFTGELLLAYPKAMIAKNFELNFFNMPDDARFMISDRLQMTKDILRYKKFCHTVAASSSAIVNHDMTPYLPELRLPVLMLFGTDDNLIPHHIMHPDIQTEQVALAAIDLIENGQLILIEECGHYVQWEKAEDFNEAVLDFVQNSN